MGPYFSISCHKRSQGAGISVLTRLRAVNQQVNLKKIDKERLMMILSPHLIVECSNANFGTQRTQLVNLSVFSWPPVTETAVAGTELCKNLAEAGVGHPGLGFKPAINLGWIGTIHSKGCNRDTLLLPEHTGNGCSVDRGLDLPAREWDGACCLSPLHQLLGIGALAVSLNILIHGNFWPVGHRSGHNSLCIN